MINRLNIDGNFNFVQQNAENSSINVIINKSADYKNLLDDLNELKEHLEDIPVEEKYQNKINRLKGKIFLKESEIEQFKLEVIRLADAFSKISVDTSRLVRAKEYFEEGKFKEADAILKLFDIDKDQITLLSARDKKDDELKEINNHLRDNSNEYYVKAQVVKLNNYTSNKFSEIFNLYKKSIKSYSGFDNNSGMADFFIDNQKYGLAVPYLLVALEHKDESDLITIGSLLTSLGVCSNEQGKFEDAETYYLDSLKILNENKDQKDNVYMNKIAITNMNIGVVFLDSNKPEKALSFLEKSLELYREHPIDSNKYLSDLSACLNNISKYYREIGKYHEGILALEEAVEIRRRLVDSEPIQYSYKLGNLLGNLAMVAVDKKDFVLAEEHFVEAVRRLEVYEILGIYSHRVTFVNLLVKVSAFYTDYYRNKERALYYAKRAIEILMLSDMIELVKRRASSNIRSIFREFNEPFPF